MLHGLLFGDGRSLSAVLRYDDLYGQQARLTLALDNNATELWRLPWEVLHDGHEFLSLGHRFLFSRQPLGIPRLYQTPALPPLRVLVVIATAPAAGDADVQGEIGIIQAALQKPLREGKARVLLLDGATLSDIGESVRTFQPHVLQYVGRAKHDRRGSWSFLVLEMDNGQTQSVHSGDLQKVLQPAQSLQVVSLSGCHSASAGDFTAFSDVALGLLQVGIPAILTMQSRLPADSGLTATEAFYDALAKGDTVAGAVHHARMSLHRAEKETSVDWAVPALYARDSGLRVLDPHAPARTASERIAALDILGLPLTADFVGRKAELEQLREGLRHRDTRAIYVLGGRGMGKSSLVAKLLQGGPLHGDGVLVLRCDDGDPRNIPTRLARFLAEQGKAPGVQNHDEATALLVGDRRPAIERSPRRMGNRRREATERARRAASLVAGRRYVFVFDGFDHLLDLGVAGTPPGQPAQAEVAFPIADPSLAGLFEGLLTAHWRSVCLFTARQRWHGLQDALRDGRAQEIVLGPLVPRQSVSLMDGLPHLRREPLERKMTLHSRLGGHPGTIVLAEGLLAGHPVDELLDDTSLDDLPFRKREDGFLRGVLDQLSAPEIEAFTRLSNVRARFTEDGLALAGARPDTVRRLVDLSLLLRVRTESGLCYVVPSVVREALLGKASPDDLRELHGWAAARRARPFLEMARQAAAASGRPYSDGELEQWARREAVLSAVHQTEDMALAYGAMADALEWQDHLFAAGQVGEADEIVIALWPILDRWGQSERANELLSRGGASRM
jgi:hypothetical protein